MLRSHTRVTYWTGGRQGCTTYIVSLLACTASSGAARLTSFLQDNLIWQTSASPFLSPTKQTKSTSQRRGKFEPEVMHSFLICAAQVKFFVKCLFIFFQFAGEEVSIARTITLAPFPLTGSLPRLAPEVAGPEHSAPAIHSQH